MSNDNGKGANRTGAEAFGIKVGLAEMLKGGVIMDVTTPEQAKIAEDAGAAAVMALERVPADIRKEGGVARMCSVEIIEGIQRDGTCWCGPTVWQGHTAMRISVCSWATTDADVEKSIQAMLRVARETAPA